MGTIFVVNAEMRRGAANLIIGAVITSNCDHPTRLSDMFLTSISEYIISTVNVLAPLGKKSDFRKKNQRKTCRDFSARENFPFPT